MQIIISTKQYYDALRTKADEKKKKYYDNRFERKLRQKLIREEEGYIVALKIFKDKGYKQKEKVSNKKSMKALAFNKFQLYCRLLRCNNEQMVKLIDIGEYVHYKKAQGGHYFAKSNYPHIAFDTLNCWPITQITNKIQGDQEGIYWKDNLINTIGQEKFDELQYRAKEGKEIKIIYDNNYYDEKFKLYDGLVIEEKKRLGIL